MFSILALTVMLAVLFNALEGKFMLDFSNFNISYNLFDKHVGINTVHITPEVTITWKSLTIDFVNNTVFLISDIVAEGKSASFPELEFCGSPGCPCTVKATLPKPKEAIDSCNSISSCSLIIKDLKVGGKETGAGVCKLSCWMVLIIVVIVLSFVGIGVGISILLWKRGVCCK